MHVFIKSACDSVSGDICDIRLTKTTEKKEKNWVPEQRIFQYLSICYHKQNLGNKTFVHKNDV